MFVIIKQRWIIYLACTRKLKGWRARCERIEVFPLLFMREV